VGRSAQLGGTFMKPPADASGDKKNQRHTYTIVVHYFQRKHQKRKPFLNLSVATARDSFTTLDTSFNAPRGLAPV
jgi:hypothetical protein